MSVNGNGNGSVTASVQQREDVGNLVQSMRAELASLAQELAAVEATAGVPRLQHSGFVPAEEIDPVIQGIRDELAALEAELASVEAAAASAEDAFVGMDPPPRPRESASAALDELEATITTMRAAGDMEITAALDHAHAHAAARIAEADAQARSIRAGGLPAFDLDDDGLIDIAPLPLPTALAPSIPSEAPPAPRPSPPVPERIETRTPDPVATAPMAVTSVAAVRGDADSVTNPEATPQKLSPIPLEALLPMVALILLLVVVLAWLG